MFNGDVGIVERIDAVEQQVAVRFDDRLVKYDFGELDEISLAYAITIHKSQGSEFPAVVIPLATQHYMLLQRNLIYTGITRGKRLLVLIGQKKALGIAVRNDRPQRRYSGLLASPNIEESVPNAGTVSAPEGSNQVDVLLHGILGGGPFDLAPGIELGGADKVEATRPFPGSIALSCLFKKRVQLQHRVVVRALGKAVHVVLSLSGYSGEGER